MKKEGKWLFIRKKESNYLYLKEESKHFRFAIALEIRLPITFALIRC